MGSKQPTASKEMISKRLLCLLSTLMAVALVNSKSADLVRRINKASIDVCLEGWLRGEASIIGAHADQENFYFQWVVDGYDSGDYTLLVDSGLLKWGRTQKLPYLTRETFQGKHLCNKPDRVCKTAVVKAKAERAQVFPQY